MNNIIIILNILIYRLIKTVKLKALFNNYFAYHSIYVYACVKNLENACNTI